MDREKIEKYLEDKGFILWSTLRGSGKVQYQFLATHENPLLQGINCIIDPESKEFEFKFIVPFTTFRLETGKVFTI
ncbi:MAG: hypothetical protein E6594_09725 [Clostridium sporogenes]|nr:hypothetical protein [Clostridium sporogenes]